MVTKLQKDKAILNLANALTILRIILAFFFMYFIFQDKHLTAFIIILIATLTDFLDGHIARIWNLQTRLGKMLDPLADKIIIFVALITLIIKLEFPLWAAFIIISRDLILFIGGFIFMYKNRKKILLPNILGKITTFFQMLTIIVYILNVHEDLKLILIILTALLTIFSAFVYFSKGFNLFFNININLPNKITIARIVTIPIFLLFLISNIQYKEHVAAGIFIILALSDALDGYIARKTKQITSFGKLIDPLADKLLISAALIFLIGKGVPPWMALAIIAREFIITGLRMVAVTKNVVMHAKLSGKIKTVTQVIAITSVIINFTYSYQLMIVAVAVTVYSGIEYLWFARSHFKELT